MSSCRDNCLPVGQSLNLKSPPATSVRIYAQHLLNRFWRSGRSFQNNRFYCSRNVYKPNTTFEECRHRYLIRRIQGNRFGASRFDCFVS